MWRMLNHYYFYSKIKTFCWRWPVKQLRLQSICAYNNLNQYEFYGKIIQMREQNLFIRQRICFQCVHFGISISAKCRWIAFISKNSQWNVSFAISQLKSTIEYEVVFYWLECGTKAQETKPFHSIKTKTAKRRQSKSQNYEFLSFFLLLNSARTENTKAISININTHLSFCVGFF